MDGYIKLHRKSLDSAVFQSPTLWKVWCWMLLRANWSTRQLHTGQVLQPGQFVLSYNRAADALDMSKSTVHRHIKTLQQLGNITLNVERKWTTITLCQWQTYNEDHGERGTIAERSSNDHRTIAERSSKQKKKERRKEGKKERTQGGFFSVDEMELEYPESLQTKEAAAAVRSWVEYQAARGTPFPTRQGVQLILDDYANRGSRTLARDITHSIRQNWAGLYAAKDTGGEDTRKPREKTAEEYWRNVLYRVAKCDGHVIEDNRCTCCLVPAEYIARATKQLKAQGVIA